MVKRLMAKVGSYEKDGQTKGRYVEIGAIMSNNNGEYALLNPSVDLAGVLMQQRIHAQQSGGRVGDRVMVSIFSNDRQGGGQQNTSYDADRGGQQNSAGGYGGAGGSGPGLEDEIPFAPMVLL